MLDEFPEAPVTQSSLIIGHGHRLRNITGLYLDNTIKLTEAFLDLARTPGEVETFDR